jgi:23S rRNA pseudouridine2457 synthase
LILLNKPYGVMCSFTDPGGRRSLADLVPIPHVYPAGRLDFDSEGLVLLTDAGWLQARISDPQHRLAKVYWVQVEGAVEAPALERLRAGVELKDGRTRPAQASVLAAPDLWPRDPPIRFRRAIPTTWLSLTLREGRKRQVRRMTAAVGHPTLRLVRVAIGEWELGGLAPGEWREVLAPPAPTTGRPAGRVL